MKEQDFFSIVKKQYKLDSKYLYLFNYFLSSFRYKDHWDKELIPYINSLVLETGKIDDWNSFEWQGVVCFRINFIFILDESIFKTGNKVPNIRNENGSFLMNENLEYLIDTSYIENNYNQYLKIPILSFLEICEKWKSRIVN